MLLTLPSSTTRTTDTTEPPEQNYLCDGYDSHGELVPYFDAVLHG
jgi:hypothetical protein